MPVSAPPIISVRDLLLARAGRVIAARCSFILHPGEGLALAGGNGAGKTSLLCALAGLLPPLGGTIIHAPSSRPGLPYHYVGHENGISLSLSLAENLQFAAAMALQPPLAPAALRHLLATWHIPHPPHALAGTLSAGNQRKLALMRLTIAPARLWLLDEPAAALDEKACARLAACCRAHLARGGGLVASRYEAIGLPPPSHRLALQPPPRRAAAS